MISDCGFLASLQNGRVDISAGTTFTKVASYTCNRGYELIGTTTRMCQATGNWSRTPPNCDAIGKYGQFGLLHFVVSVGVATSQIKNIKLIEIRIFSTTGILTKFWAQLLSIVSLTSSLRDKLIINSFMTLLPTALIFFVEKMREAFAVMREAFALQKLERSFCIAKASHIFSTKIMGHFRY